MRVLSHRALARRSGASLECAAFPVTPLAAKAEVILGVQLVTRHRSVRLAALLAAGITVAVAASAPSVDRVTHVMLWIGGTIAALAGSRLLAAGPALAAARMVGAPPWLPPLGRLVGALCVVAPATLAAGVAMLATAHGAAPLAGVAGVVAAYTAAVGAVVMALAPLLGATGSAALGILAVWLGAVFPSTQARLLGPTHAWAWIACVLLGLGLAGRRVGGRRGPVSDQTP